MLLYIVHTQKILYKRLTYRGFSLGGGSRTRTCDLWVMSPTSYHCSIPRCFGSAKVDILYYATKYLR